MQPERKLVKKIQKLIADRGGRSFKIQGSDETYQENGIPDLLICYRGIFIGAEVKQPGAKLRPSQRVVLHEIYDAGGVAAVLETVEQAEDLLAFFEDGGLDDQVCFDRGRFSSACGFD